jgi:hypothetical protein
LALFPPNQATIRTGAAFEKNLPLYLFFGSGPHWVGISRFEVRLKPFRYILPKNRTFAPYEKNDRLAPLFPRFVFGSRLQERLRENTHQR